MGAGRWSKAFGSRAGRLGFGEASAFVMDDHCPPYLLDIGCYVVAGGTCADMDSLRPSPSLHQACLIQASTF